MASSSRVIPVIFDSDGGIDDAAALWRICRSPLLQLLAVTATAGNVSLEQAGVNLSTVLHAAGHGDIPVALGQPDPLGPGPSIPQPSSVHGHDGLGDVGLARVGLTPESGSAVEVLRELVADRPDQITVIAVGPLSNIAAAVREDALWASRVRQLVFMGGSLRRGGNVTAVAEANVAMDPTAAGEVIAANWARPPIMVGLDVTLKATLEATEFALLGERLTPAAEFLHGPLSFYRANDSGLTDDGGCPCHDLLAVFVAEDESIVQTDLLPLAVDNGFSNAWGATVTDSRPRLLERWEKRASPCDWPQIRVAVDVDVRRFRARVRTMFGTPMRERNPA